MVETASTPGLGLNGKKRTFWRVVFVAVSMAFIFGITGVVFFFIPMINDSVKLALAEGGIVFVGVVIVPAGILAAITTVWAIMVLWQASGGDPDDGD